MTIKKAGHKISENLTSWKFYLLVLSTVLFIKGILSENGWLMMAASTTGLRELVNLVTLKLGAQTEEATVEKQPKSKKVDNPDNE